jgi:hypothetical protein
MAAIDGYSELVTLLFARYTAKRRILGCPNIRWAGVMVTSIEPAALGG